MNITVEGGKSKKLLTGGKYCPEDITVTAEGGGGPVAVEEKDVNFYDYDGTCLYAYTIAEAQALTELPPGPTHEGLVFQEWNWSLEDVKALDQFMVIGANYITDDGKTRLYISIEYDQHLTVPLHIRQSVSEGVEIDWGDGSAVETISGTDEVNTSHTYAQLGEYIIRLNVVSGSVGLGTGTVGKNVFGTEHKTLLRRVELGGGFTSASYGIGVNAFNNQYLLEIVTIAKGLLSIGNSAFQYCYALSGALVFPQGVDAASTYFCYDCTALKIVSFPKSQMYIGNSSLRGCRSLKYTALYRGSGSQFGVYNYGLQDAWSLLRIEQPDAAPNLRTSALSGCYSLTEFDVKPNIATINSSALKNCTLMRLRFWPTTPPTVENANAFQGIPTTCRVEVPAASLEAYQNATNYSGIAAQMVGV